MGAAIHRPQPARDFCLSLRRTIKENGKIPLRTRVKICGVTRAEDALTAAAHGCDAIGLVFYPPSRRWIDPAAAADIAAAVPPFVTVVGLFVDAPPQEIKSVLRRVRLDMLQFHGSETAAECARHGMPYLKAVRVRPETNLLQYAESYPDAKALLLDAYVAGQPGGTGQRFDWNLIPRTLPLPVVLAGGLSAGNVATAIEAVRPYAVDVSGGVENNQGIKDAAKIAAFMQGVIHAGL